MKLKISAFILALLLFNSNLFSQGVWFNNPTNGSTQSTYFMFYYGFTYSGDPDRYDSYLKLVTHNATYLDYEANWPTSFTLNPGTYTWYIKLYERYTGQGTFEVASQTITFYVPYTIQIDNNFSSGILNIDGAQYSTPRSVSKISGSTLSLGAIDQYNGGYQRVWNTSGTYNSEWKEEGEYLSNNRNYSHSVTSADDGATITAYLRKVCNINYKATLDGTESNVSIEVNSSPATTPTSAYNVVEQNEVYAHVASSFYQNDIYYIHQNWTWSGGSYQGGPTLTIYPTEHKEITANYTGRPEWYSVSRNLHTNTYNSRFPNTHVTLYWIEHPNTNVTQYKIYRKVNGGSETYMGSVNRGTTSWADPNYAIRNSGGVDQLQYDVRAYYTVNGNTSNPSFIYTWGEIPGAGKQIAENELNTEKIIVDNYSIGNFPNPFNPATTINYQLPEQGHVTIKVYDMLGKEVAELVNEVKDMGIYNAAFDGSNLASGIYVYTINVKGLSAESKGYAASKKMLLIK